MKPRGSRSSETQAQPKEPVNPSNKNAIVRLINENPQMYNNCIALLQTRCNQWGRIDVKEIPVVRFFFEQAVMTAEELRTKLDNQMVTFVNIQNVLVNFIYLYQDKMRKLGPASVVAAEALHSLIICLADVSNFLEKCCQVPETDWPSLGKMYMQEAADEGSKGQSISHIPFIPTLADFEFKGVISSNKNSTIHSVIHKKSGLPMALKATLLSTYTESVSYIDAVTAAVTKTPFLPTIICVFLANPDVSVMVMQEKCIDGSPRLDLKLILDHQSCFSSLSTVIIVYQLFLAVEHLHHSGLIHRDINPSNVLVDNKGHAKLNDMNRSKICLGHYSRNVLKTYFTRTCSEFVGASVVNLLMYSAPEVLKAGRYGRSIDIYSLGIMMYKICTGIVPFRSDDPNTLRNHIISGEFVWPTDPHVPKDLKEVTACLLNKNPQKRIGCRQMYDEIHKHTVFSDLVSKLEKAPFCPETGFTLCSQASNKIFSTEVLVDLQELFNDRVASSAQQMNVITPKDKPRSAQNNLTCFASSAFIKFIESASKKKLCDDGEVIITACNRPTKDLDYETVESSDTLRQLTQTMTGFQLSPATTRVVIPVGKRFACAPRRALVNLCMTTGSGNILYAYIKKTPPSKNSGNVITGDILVSIGDDNVVDTPLDRIKRLLSDMAKNPEVKEIPCEVYSYGMFRLTLVDNFSTCREYMQAAVQSTISLKKSARSKRTIETSAKSVWRPDLAHFVYVHIITYVDPTCLERDAIFYGDLLWEINLNCLENLTDAAVQRLLQKEKLCTLTILETSVIRKKQLVERDIQSPSSYQEL